MKQGMRFFVKPGTFMSQLQWSTHHWVFLTFFLILGVIETFTGSHHAIYQNTANMIHSYIGVGFNVALGFIIAVKLVLMLVGAFALASLIWFVGSLFGRQGSKRVLFRRFATVFAVVLAGYICQNLSHVEPLLFYLGYVLYAWAMVLGYFSIREQFSLNTIEALVVGLFAVFLITSTWQYSHDFFSDTVNTKVIELTKKPIDKTSMH